VTVLQSQDKMKFLQESLQ